MYARSYRALLQTSCSLALILGMTASAKAELSISNKPTQNVTCNAGICAATAMKAVLNVTDLGNMLAAGNVIVQSGSDAEDIAIDAPFSWTSSNALMLDSNRSITVNKPVSDAGPGALTLTTNDGGTDGDLTFIGNGKISFLGTANAFVIDGQAYTLVDSIATLATAAATNPGGSYALSNDYDATGDGIYGSSPVGQTLDSPFEGTINGLGNHISHFAMTNEHRDGLDGLVGVLTSPGTISNLGVTNAVVQGGKNSDVGILVGQNYFGFLLHDFSTGSVSIKKVVGSNVGGLVGFNVGTIDKCRSAASIKASSRSFAGGLVGANVGTVSNSFASGTADTGHSGKAGGLAGYSADSGVSNGIIINSYATGAVTGDNEVFSGGLVGESGVSGSTGAISMSYATGLIAGGPNSTVGGLIGSDNMPAGSVAHSYWNMDTSGIGDPAQGAGNIPNDPGIKGLRDSKLKAGLPKGFDPAVWAQSPTINNGYPYLIDNPPAK